VEGEGLRRPGRLRDGRRAQATLEFAFSAPLLLLCLFAAIDAAAWAVQNSAAVAAVEEGARLAASAPDTPLGQSAPDARQVTDGVIRQLQPAMFGTGVRPWCTSMCGDAAARPCSGADCRFQACPSTPDEVASVFGPRVVAVCVQENTVPRCTVRPTSTTPGVPPYCGDSPTVTVRAIGFMASLVPPSLGLGWHSGEIPVQVTATTHALRFAP
jgi:Flp pilus assembly protein TadG